MMACRALALLPLPAPSRLPRPRAASLARLDAARRRASASLLVRCCANPADPGGQEDPPQDAVLKAISQVANSKGRVAQTTNVVMGGTVTDDATDEWLVLDKQVNTYPTVRGFTAIGTGGDDFVQAMVVAVESVLEEQIPKAQISHKVSSKGKYVSVKIGPIPVVSSEQVQAVYNAMKKDERMKFFLLGMFGPYFQEDLSITQLHGVFCEDSCLAWSI
ncbi:uncharacterized protein LOC127764695 [Oryza glaberrima]|uniref:uncharacterized protein LOC127764695 n=1 Tax=Oryza glaberrima TaxID=4538 RepID=UPI00224C02B3|nr:uncharacterized protein LOC127764695 [Oryza glaberrima]